MAIPTGTLTSSSTISNLVQTAYDQYVRMALRSIPVMRALADVKPVQQAMPGSSVVFSIYSDLSTATGTLTETSDVSSVALGNPSQVTVTLNEYGNAVTTTKKLNLTSFNDVDAALADVIAYNAADSIDVVVANVLTSGTNVIYGGTATGTSGITASGTMTVADIREAVVQLRTNKAVPRIGELYAAYLHPRQSADLRAEAGTGGFQELTKYVERTPLTVHHLQLLSTRQLLLVVKHLLKHKHKTSQPLSVQKSTLYVVSAPSVGTTSADSTVYVKRLYIVLRLLHQSHKLIDSEGQANLKSLSLGMSQF